jgi:hypothetical protein
MENILATLQTLAECPTLWTGSFTVCSDYQKELRKMQDIFSSKSIFIDHYL